MPYLILTSEEFRARFINEARSAGLSVDDLIFATNKAELENRFNEYPRFEFLISFSTSVIVPIQYIRIKDQVSVNIHAASPSYPGRDPHHYAVYDNVKIYGATLHHMSEKVDEGDIIDVELFDVEDAIKPYDLMLKANEAAWMLIGKLFRSIKNKTELPRSNHKWQGIKRTRKDFQDYCRISHSIDMAEFQRRVRAFHVVGYQNLYTEIHGMKFFLDTHDT